MKNHTRDCFDYPGGCICGYEEFENQQIEERSVKGLLLEIRNTDNYELKVIAEETLVNKFSDLEAELQRHKDLLREQCNRSRDLKELLDECAGYIQRLDTAFGGAWPEVAKLLEKLKGGSNESL